MSKVTDNFLKVLNYEKIKQRRESNFRILANTLNNINELKLPGTYIGTYMYPFLQQNGRRIKKELIQNKIFVPTLWPNVLHECNNNLLEYYFADNMVCLPIDQRYDERDMQFILKVLEELLNDY